MRYNSWSLRRVLTLSFICVSGSVYAQGNDDHKDTLKRYLVDVGTAPISAANIVGATGSAITNVQTSQDLVLSLNPFGSNASKGAFGVAITPARTAIDPIYMSGLTYFDKDRPWNRLIGAATISYAENPVTVGGIAYRRSGFSLDTSYYWDVSQDPVMQGYQKFKDCAQRKEFEDKRDAARLKNDKESVDKFEALAGEAHNKCQKDPSKQAQWNATKFSISYGVGHIRPESTTGVRHSLGRSLAVTGAFRAGPDSAVYLTLRRVTGEIDMATIPGAPAFKSSQLAAVRFTSNSTGTGAGDFRWLAEASNAKASSATLSNTNFKYALGIDKKITTGVWLEFRVGKSRAVDSTSTQTVGLMTLNWTPSSNLFAK